jgi:hypothetical protein
LRGDNDGCDPGGSGPSAPMCAGGMLLGSGRLNPPQLDCGRDLYFRRWGRDREISPDDGRRG